MSSDTCGTSGAGGTTKHCGNVARSLSRKVLSHSMGKEAYLQSLVAIPELFKHAVFIDEQANNKNNNKYNSYRYYVAGLKIDDIDYTVKMTVAVDEYGNKYYD